MRYLLDTGILLVYLRDKPFSDSIDNQYHPLEFPNIPVISVVTIGELKSIGIQNQWSSKRQANIDDFAKQFLIADINVATVIQRYAEIDAFSQGKLPGRHLGFTSRNMGKNDLWIAATASVLDATLITLDKDFLHLDNEFLKLVLIDSNFQISKE